MIQALRRLLNRRWWNRATFASWHLQCHCLRCNLHPGPCPFPQSGERYKHRSGAIVSYCSACALNHDDLELDRSWGKGHGSKNQWGRQQADFGQMGVFH